MSPRKTNTKDVPLRLAKPAATAWTAPGYAALPGIAPSERINPPKDPTMLGNRSQSPTLTQTHLARHGRRVILHIRDSAPWADLAPNRADHLARAPDATSGLRQG